MTGSGDGGAVLCADPHSIDVERARGRKEVGVHCLCGRTQTSDSFPLHGVRVRQIANTLLEKFDPAGRLLLFL